MSALSFIICFSLNVCTYAASPPSHDIRLDCSGMMDRFSSLCGEDRVASFRSRCQYLETVREYRHLYYAIQTELVDCYIL